MGRQPDQTPRSRSLRPQIYTAKARQQVVGQQPPTLGGTQNTRLADAGRSRGGAHSRELPTAAGDPVPAPLHRQSPSSKSEGMEFFSRAGTHQPAPLCRLDSYSQAARDAKEAHSRIDRAARGRQETGAEMRLDAGTPRSIS